MEPNAMVTVVEVACQCNIRMPRLMNRIGGDSPALDHEACAPSIPAVYIRPACPPERSRDSFGILRDRLVADVMIGTFVTALAAPALTIVDKAIVQRSAGTHSIWSSARATILEIVQHPVRYLKSPTFLCMWATYAATFSTANALKTIAKHYEQDEKVWTKSQAATVVFVGTTAVNTSASLIKDRVYARLFSSTGANTSTMLHPPSLPMASYGFWLARDFTTMGASFMLPDLVMKYLEHESTFFHSMSPAQVTLTAQMITPMVAQVVAGPLHLLGLEVYQHQTSLLSSNWRPRWSSFQKSVVPVVIARMARIVPGYGLAGYVNRQWRDQYQQGLMQPHTDSHYIQLRSLPTLKQHSTHYQPPVE